MLESKETLCISSDLRYHQYLISASHDNYLPSLFGIISGADNYWGTHIMTLLNNTFTITQGENNKPLKVYNAGAGAVRVNFIPIGLLDDTSITIWKE